MYCVCRCVCMSECFLVCLSVCLLFLCVWGRARIGRALVATVSIGAVWSVCAPDMGTNAVLDRIARLVRAEEMA